MQVKQRKCNDLVESIFKKSTDRRPLFIDCQFNTQKIITIKMKSV